MKIWFDILTPKQVMFFQHAVSLLQKKGHDVLCTSREYREANELAKMKKLELVNIGRHGGADKFEKLVASAERTYELAKEIKDFSPDVGVTFSSPEGCRVAFGLGIRQIGFNDSPHSTSVASLTIPLMNELHCPWIIKYKEWKKFGIARNSIKTYKALDPVAWLKHVRPINSEQEKKSVLIRLEESKASYIADSGRTSTKLVDTAVNEFSKVAEVKILCRYLDQIDEAKRKYGEKATILEGIFDGVSLIKEASLFVGAGGTMSAEAALLGIPTISIAPRRYSVEDYLVGNGLVRRTQSPSELVSAGRKLLSDETLRHKQQQKASRALESMEDPTQKMISAILKR